MTSMHLCPCGSGRGYHDCCGPALSGERPAATAEALMRSRFTAFARGDTAYLRASWHRDTRPAQLELDERLTWDRLEIFQVEGGGVNDGQGRVGFAAHYRSGAGTGCLRELSRFVHEQGRWFYVDGAALPRHEAGRNAPCPCGSGRKFKRCCGR